MDGVRKTFDKWAQNGRAELMEIEHGKNVLKFLKTIQFDKPFTFLDVGCGNGWVVRKIAKEKNCKKAIGIQGRIESGYHRIPEFHAGSGRATRPFR